MKCRISSFRSGQQGMALLSAIFILVVLALIGAFSVQVSTMQHIGSTQDLQSARVLQAARAGLEWALFRVQPANGGNCAGATNLALTGDSFAGITVTVTCTGSTTLYQITSVACTQAASCPKTSGIGNLYIERQLEAKLRTDTN